MQFLWEGMLPALVLVPLLIAAYILAQRRRSRFTLRYSSLMVLRDVVGKRPGWRRHVPPLLFLLGITAMLLGVARPYALIWLPKQEATVILSIDVSGSMRADDLKPSRFEAARAAARLFVDRQSENTRIGVVAFSGVAMLVQGPTTDKDAVFGAINRLTLERSTAIGSGILTSLEAISEANDPISITAPVTGTQALSAAPRPTLAAPAPGQRTPAIIILLTDGQNVTGPRPVDAAQKAAEMGVRVYTIGVGTVRGTTLRQAGGFGFNTELDETTLKRVAEITGGEYFHASDENALSEIYKNLDTQVIVRSEKMELTAGFTAAAVLLSIFGAFLSLFWFGRLP